MINRTLALASLVVFGAVHALSQPAAGSMTSISDARLRAILQQMGFRTSEKPGEKVTIFTFELNGSDVHMVNYAKDLNLYIGFTDKVAPTVVNDWNRDHRFSRAYVNQDGNPFIEWDLDLEGGVTQPVIERYIRLFGDIYPQFAQFITKAGKPEAKVEETPAEPPRPALRQYRRSASATSKIRTPYGDFAIWINPAKWRQAKGDVEGVLQFQHTNGEAYARLITERTGIPLDTLRDIALTNAKSADPNAEIVLEEHRIVNGREILALQIDGTLKNIPFRYFGYYYGGNSGTVQAVTYTVKSAFTRNLPEFTEFLNGLEIYDEKVTPVQQSGLQGPPQLKTLTLGTGVYRVAYDSRKWKYEREAEKGRHSFNHFSGNGYGLVIYETLEIPLDSLPEIALMNAQKEDPNAKIVSQEKRTVNGVQVWRVRLEGVIKGIPFTFLGNYYAGPGGTIQVLTYTSQTLFKEFERDFNEFLNGLRVQ